LLETKLVEHACLLETKLVEHACLLETKLVEHACLLETNLVEQPMNTLVPILMVHCQVFKVLLS